MSEINSPQQNTLTQTPLKQLFQVNKLFSTQQQQFIQINKMQEESEENLKISQEIIKMQPKSKYLR